MGTMMRRSVTDALCALADAVDSQQAAELGQVLAIATVCELYRVSEESVLAGAERLLRFGGVGTPQVGEFVLGEIGPILGISLESARQRVAEVLDLRFRHPRLWEAVCAGKVRPWQAFKVTQATNVAHLDADAADWVDSQVAVALAFQPIGRVLGQVPTWILQADPALAAEREAEKAASRYVRFSDLTDGQTDLWGRLDAADGLVLDEALDTLADDLAAVGIAGGRDVLRSTALGVLARQALGQDPLGDLVTGTAREPRRATLHIHLTPDAITDGVGVAQIDGWGPLLTDRLGELLAGSRVTVRPVIDLNQTPAVDGYEIPDRLRQAVCARNPVDVFPYGTRRAESCDLDHREPYVRGGPSGQTTLANLAPLSRKAHRLKHHAGWKKCHHPVPGYHLWRSPNGFDYLVGPDGTTTINRPDWIDIDDDELTWLKADSAS